MSGLPVPERSDNDLRAAVEALAGELDGLAAHEKQRGQASRARDEFWLGMYAAHSADAQSLRRLLAAVPAVGVGAQQDDKMRAALLLIGGVGCENFTRGHCEANGRQRGAEFGADAWCDACIANAALGRPRSREHLAAAAPLGVGAATEPVEETAALDDRKKLLVLADWFDVYDDQHGYAGAREVQADLRRIAADLVRPVVSAATRDSDDDPRVGEVCEAYWDVVRERDDARALVQGLEVLPVVLCEAPYDAAVRCDRPENHLGSHSHTTDGRTTWWELPRTWTGLDGPIKRLMDYVDRPPAKSRRPL